MADKPSARGAEAPLAKYKAKRNFSVTPEPAGTGSRRAAGRKQQAPSFVIQKHWASRLHYDFRLEHGGVMLSWAVPKGPSFDPAVKQMAIHVEDHPISYSDFEGEIPKKQYGAGTVIVWDRGTWEPVGDVAEGLAKGKLIFHLHGEKLAGLWELVRISKPGDKKQEQWLLLKKRGDGWTRSTADYDVIAALPDSVIAHPLGLLEDREAPAATAKRSPVQADGDEPDLTNAVKGKMPEVLEPQLATLVSAAPAGGSWIIENKYDGYRMLARIVGGDVRLLTRKGNDWTSKLKELASHVEALGIADAYLDGEIVVLDEKGVPDFNRLQNAIDNSRSKDLVYFVFDVPFLADTDLRAVPLMSRRAVLKRLMAQSESERIRFSEAFDVSPDQLLAAACHMGLEGVMLKQATAPYVEGRTETWLKLKCQKRQEFIVVGFNDRKDSTTEVGNLLLGYHDKGKLLYAGAVGTGWSNATARELHQLLAKHETDVPAVDASAVKPGRWSQRSAGAKHWVEPKVIVEVAFGEWTPDGHIRHASFRGVRTDKPAAEVDREKAKDVAAPKTAALKADAAVPAASKRGSRASPTAASKLKITHPERVIDPASGTTKIELVRYYESVADWMLPHLAGRPVSLVRAPQGVGQQLFFQKHPDEVVPAGHTPASYLRKITYEGAGQRWPQGMPAKVQQLIEYELSLVAELRYEHYFLTVADIVMFARSRGILCQGRGSAANSVICYCVGVTEVDPARMSVLVERFISKERNEPPDIDIDFEHERREEVLQYLYNKYGRDRAAITGVVISYRPKSAIRDVGKALGFSLDEVDTIAKGHQWWDGSDIADDRVREAGLEPDDLRVQQLLQLTRQLLGFPRHLSQHTGGMVLTKEPLSRIVPIENASMADRTVIEWDKDDLDAMGLLKVDCLALGMLTAIRKALDFIGERQQTVFGMQDIPAEDTETYDMICKADTVGVFQIESRAQMSMLPRHRPRCFYDLVVQVAIVRPGPIVGGMVHPYIRRRQGLEPVTYPSAALEEALGRTLGVPVFQEQVMQIAMLPPQ